MPAPWNFCSACLLAKSDHIGGDRLDLLSRGHVIPLGPAPWNEIRALSRLPGGMLNTPSEGSIVTSYRHEITVPYYIDIKYLESKTVTQLREHLEYFTEQIITSFGIPQAIATSTGDATNRATLNTSIKVLETTLKQLVTNTVRQIEHNLFMPIARSHGRGTIPSYEWDDIDTSGLKAELEQKRKPNTEQDPKQKPSEFK